MSPGTPQGSTQIRVGEAPIVEAQSSIVRVPRDHSATLNVVTAAEDAYFEWFEGARGDTTHRVGVNTATFTTPPVTGTKYYWVRLTTGCGIVDSESMTVTLSGRRRAVSP
jgi:hypothetical protein